MHSSHFIELLHHPAMLGPVQTMSRVYKGEGEEDVRTPVDMVDATSKYPWFKSEVGFHIIIMSARSRGRLNFRCTDQRLQHASQLAYYNVPRSQLDSEDGCTKGST